MNQNSQAPISKGSIRKVIAVVPHITLGDNIIVLSLMENLVKSNPQIRFVFYINNGFTSLYRSVQSLDGSKIKNTRLNPWKYSNYHFIGNLWRKLITAWILCRITLTTFPNFNETLVIGPDWMTSSDQELDLFNSFYVRCLSRAFIPSLEVRKELKNARRLNNWDHRQFIRWQLLSVGLILETRDTPLVAFARQSPVVSNFLVRKGAIDSAYMLCFLGAGNQNRDWTTQNEGFLQKVANDNYQKIVFVDWEDRETLGPLVNYLELISLANLVVSNDTGWAHCAIELQRPLLCISAIKRPELDSYVKESDQTVVIRPDEMLDECDKFCVRNYYHCVSTISYQEVAQSVRRLLTSRRYLSD
jgi:ADP-heptose:LPS heptosyltransferase